MYDALWAQTGDYFQMLFGIGNDTPHFDVYYCQMNNWYREFESNIYNDSHTLIRFNAFVRLFSFGNYHIHTLFMCFLAMIGLTALFKTFQCFVEKLPWLLLFCVFAIPSVIFWGSGVLKEGLLLFGIGLLVWCTFRWVHHKFTLWGGATMLFCALLLFHIKLYVLTALLPGLIAYFWVARTQHKWVVPKYLAVWCFSILAGLNLHRFFPQFHLLQLLVRKQKDFFGLAAFENSGSLINIPHLEPTFLRFLSTAPVAFWNTLTQPHIHPTHNSFMILAALENMGIYGAVVASIFFLKPIKTWNWNLLFFCLSFVVLLFVVTGWITPVVGAMVRYKVPALPFLLLFLLLLTDADKVISFRKRIIGCGRKSG